MIPAQTVGILLIVLSCSALGFGASFGLAGRVRNLREIQNMMEMLKGEIRYASVPLQEAFASVALRCPEPFAGFLEKTALEMGSRDGRTLAVILKENSAVLQNETGLRREDIERFLRAGAGLGYLDQEMQLRMIGFYLEELERECRQAEEEYQGKGKVYRCLGIMSGLFLAVIFL